MLYALAHPLAFAVLLGSYVAGVALHGWVQALTASRFGDARIRLEHRTAPDPRRHIDPFGAVAAAIAGLGWTLPVTYPDRRRRLQVITVALVGPAVNVVLGLGLLVAFRIAYGPVGIGAPALLLQRGTGTDGHPVELALLLVGLSQLYLGALSLVPLPPLDGGRLLFALARSTPGWQRAEFRLVEQNIGVGVLLALLLIPLGGPQPLLPQLLDTVLAPVVRLVTGG